VSEFQATRTRDAVQQCSFVLLEMMFEITSSLLYGRPTFICKSLYLLIQWSTSPMVDSTE